MIDPARLLQFATDAYRAVGMSDDDVHLAADTLVQADLWASSCTVSCASLGISPACVQAHARPLPSPSFS
ncbi:MAG: hypothetical protein ACRYG8_04070 [Janthinobacterium lividum]